MELGRFVCSSVRLLSVVTQTGVMLNLSCIRFHIHQSVMRDTLCCMHYKVVLMRVSYMGKCFFFGVRIGSVTYYISRWILTIFSFCVSQIQERRLGKKFFNNSLIIGLSCSSQPLQFRKQQQWRSPIYNEPTHKYQHPILNAMSNSSNISTVY